jgi:hypothetical protein
MFISILLLILLFVPGYGSFYWSSPAVFMPFTLIGEAGAFFGSLMVRKYFFQGLRKETYFYDALVIIGDGLVLVGLLGAVSALLTGVAVAMNPMNWGKYYGSGHSYNNMILASQEMSYWVGVACLTVGQFVIGFGHKRKFEQLLPHQIHAVKQTLKTKS